MNQTLRLIGPALLAGWLATSAIAALADDPDLVGTVVDATGQGVANVSLRGMLRAQAVETKSTADGSFRITLPLNPQATGRVWGSLMASAPDGRMGMLPISQADGHREPVKLVVKPPHELAVVVVDRDGKPVGGAEVDFLNGMIPILSGSSDAEGRWATKVPVDAIAWSLLVRKGGVGFDYATGERARGSKAAALPLPAEIKLTLDGVKPVRVKVVDNEFKPIVGAKVGPWLFQKPGRETQLNLGGMMSRWPVTGPDGTVALDWWPDIPRYRGSLLVHADGYYVPDHAIWLEPNLTTEEVTIAVLPLERLAGRVMGLDGKAAAGAKVEFQGQGAGSNSFRGSSQTDAAGRFEAKVYSEQAYIVTATLGNLAAPYRDDVVVRAGTPTEGVDLVLGPGTRIRGRVTVGKEDRPVPKTSVTLVIKKGEIPKELQKPGDRVYHEVDFRTWVQTDGAGRYEFIVGPGEYEIEGPARIDRPKFVIPAEDPPAELVVELKMPRAETGPLTLTVVDTQGRPVADAVVDGMYASSQARRWFDRQKTDAKGAVNVERSLDPLILQATSADGKLGAIVRLDAEATEAQIVLGPLVKATGRLLDTDGKPVAQRKLNWAIQVHMSEEANSPWTNSFGASVVTGDDGRFTLIDLVPDHEYDLSLPTGDDGSAQSVTKLTAQAPGPLDLGELAVDTRPFQPYVPPTAKQRTAEAFAAAGNASPKQRLASLLVEAKREYTRPLLVFGKADDPACVELFRLFYEPLEVENQDAPKKPPSPASLRWEFELLALDIAKPDVRDLARELGVEVGDGHPPILVVLDSKDKPSANYPLTLDGSKPFEGPALARFLDLEKRDQRNADAMLTDAQARAKNEGKRVFLIASASWCGPCRLLARFLEAHKADLDPYFVFVKLDISRDLDASGLLDHYPESGSAGVPWFAILNPDGTPLITSSMPDKKGRATSTNIGFPSSRDDVDHFARMLRESAPRLPAEKIEEMKKALLKK